MSFGDLLSQEFDRLTEGYFSEEIILFAKLEDAFINLSHMCSSSYNVRYGIDIIHGHKSFVDFEYNGTFISSITTPKNIKKELADMMFVVFSNKKREIRLSYMQNKKGANNYRRFPADLLQLYLLKDRPEITSPVLPACVFGNPRILSDAILPSVGSYGVFYRDIQNRGIELSYFPASNLQPYRSTGGEKRVVRFTNRCGPLLVNGFEESQGEATLSKFGDALIGMTIGTPMIAGKSKEYGKVCSFLQNNSRTFSEADFLARNEIEENWDINLGQFQDSFPTVVIINADVFEGLDLYKEKSAFQPTLERKWL